MISPLAQVDLARWLHRHKLINRDRALRWITGVVDVTTASAVDLLDDPRSARSRYGAVRPRGDR